MKFFNTSGPVNMANHYKIDPLRRIDLEEVLMLIDQQKYFVLHAPRQTGKTSCMLALRDYLNEKGKYYALYINVEAGQASRNNRDAVVQGIMSEIALQAEYALKDLRVKKIVENLFVQQEFATGLNSLLTQWCAVLDKPLVLFIDEIDALIGDSLISVLRQICGGYAGRPGTFPSSIILCGVRDVRDYRIHTSNQEIVTGGSAFNIKAKSLHLGNFNKEEIYELYLQHTEETGQVFDPSCFPLVWEYTEGQPWLVNALGYEVTVEMKENRDRSVVLTPEMLRRAKENLILRRETHLDQLSDKLRESRVQRVVGPILASADVLSEEHLPSDDLQYVKDLGLVVKGTEGLRIANAIYREVIPRELTWTTQEQITQKRLWYLREDGSIDMEKLLLDFQHFFRQNADVWMERFDYKEAGPQLLLQAFLQRIVNGGGYIQREYGLGRKCTDLLVSMPYAGGEQEVVIETKIKYEALETVISEGLKQTVEYMDRCGTRDGHLIVFNREKGISWDEKIWHREEACSGQKITVWGM